MMLSNVRGQSREAARATVVCYHSPECDMQSPTQTLDDSSMRRQRRALILRFLSFGVT